MAVGGGVAETPAGVVRAGMTRGDDDSDGSMDNLKMDSRMAGHGAFFRLRLCAQLLSGLAGKKRKMFSRLHGMLLLSPRPGIDFGHETSSPQTGKHLKREQHAAAQMNAVSSAVANAGQTLGTPGAPPAMRKRPERGTPLRSCKIRMLTWNMHDSLPKVCFVCQKSMESLTLHRETSVHFSATSQTLARLQQRCLRRQTFHARSQRLKMMASILIISLWCMSTSLFQMARG